jgi:hypothetical protein
MTVDDHETCASITQLQHKIDELVIARAAIDMSLTLARSELGQFRNRRTPVYSLPDEILAVIFDTGSHLQGVELTSFPVIISHVKHDLYGVSMQILRD